jgi:hypothetical protein
MMGMALVVKSALCLVFEGFLLGQARAEAIDRAVVVGVALVEVSAAARALAVAFVQVGALSVLRLLSSNSIVFVIRCGDCRKKPDLFSSKE